MSTMDLIRKIDAEIEKAKQMLEEREVLAKKWHKEDEKVTK